MKLIPLSQGKFAKVDDADYEWLNQWKWYAAKNRGKDSKSRMGFYAVRCVTVAKGVQKTIKMHRAILGLTDPNIKGDHINQDTLDNCRANLREANLSQSSANRRAQQNGTSNFVGVCWCNTKKCWIASITKNKRHYTIGRFKDEVSAAIARDKKAIEFHGEFAKVNFPHNV